MNYVGILHFKYIYNFYFVSIMLQNVSEKINMFINLNF